MTTPLFPEDGTPVTIRQGNTGDCYFLASLDCILNAGPEGIEKIKSLFTPTSHGVTVRIKRTSIGTHLKVDKLKGKYDYVFDKDRNEDVFIISQDRLNIIDGNTVGVTTNSLAVKILEHLSSYYYVEDWSPDGGIMDSVIAHNVTQRHTTSSTVFVGNLLDIPVQDTRNIDQIIKLKNLDPSYPVYISMSYGTQDSFGNFHGRHGLRLKRIEENTVSPDGYDFVLANPWDNQKEERYSLNDIKSRNYRFSLFNPNSVTSALITHLLDLPVDDGRFILASPDLLKLLLELKNATSRFSSADVRYYLELYKGMSKVTPLFNLLTEEEQKHFLQTFSLSNGNIDSFLTVFLRQVHRLEIVRFILSNEKLGPNSTLEAIDICLREKDNELFSLLNTVNFLNYINRSSLDKNVFLKNLIQLHLTQTSINLAPLKAIIAYIQEYNAANPTPLTVVFSKEHLFRSIVEQAIKVKGKEYVESGLIAYYFNGNNTYITSAGQLRSLFLDESFRVLIETIDSPEWIISGTVQFINTSIVTPCVSEKIRTAEHITVKQLDKTLRQVITQAPRTLFATLHKLSKLNPELARLLVHKLIEQFPMSYSMEFAAFASPIQSEPSSEFTRWFSTVTPQNAKEALQEKARFIISNYLEKIQNFSFSFQSAYSVDSIEKLMPIFILNLQGLGKEKELYEAIEQLPVKEAADTEELVNKAIMQKIKSIELAAETHKSALTEIDGQVTKLIESIQQFSYSFSDVYTESDIEQLSGFYITNLKRLITENIPLADMLKNLGTTELPESISKAFNDKSAAIKQASLKQKELVIEAQITITRAITNANSFSYSFEHIFSITDMSQQSAQLLERLYNILNDKKVIQAQQLLGIKENTPSALTNAIENQAQLIIEKAEYRINTITKAGSALNSCIQDIQNVPITFSHLNLELHVESEQRRLLMKLEQLVTDSKVKEALVALGFNKELSPSIKDALTARQAAIRNAAKERNLVIVATQQRERVREAEQQVDMYLKRIRAFVVDFPVVTREEAITKQTTDLLNALHQIGLETPLQEALVQTPLAREHIQKEITAKEESILNTAKQHNQQLKIKEAQETLEQCHRQISEFPISYTSCDSAIKVQNQQGNLLDQLNLLASTTKVQQALAVLELAALPHPIKESLSSQQDLIRRAAIHQNRVIVAAQQRERVREAEQQVERYLKRIRVFVVDFPVVTSEEVIAKQTRELLIKLHQIERETQLQEALVKVPLAKQHIQKEIVAKEESIRSTAKQHNQQLKIKEAQETLAQCHRLIREFPISYTGLDSTIKILNQKEALLARLASLVNTTKVQHALGTLKLTTLPQPIKDSLYTKQTDVHSAAAQRSKELIAIQQAKLVREAEQQIKVYLERIRNSSSNFPKLDSEDEITTHRDRLIAGLKTLRNESILKDALAKVPSAHQSIADALTEKETLIRTNAATKLHSLVCTKAQMILENSGFLTHLKTMLDKTVALEKKAKNRSSYKEVALKARELYTCLDNAKIALLTPQPGTLEEKLKTFKESSMTGIKATRSVLGSHRGCKQIFADIANAILSICSIGITYLATHRWRLFKTQTDSEKKSRALEQNILQISIPAGG